MQRYSRWRWDLTAAGDARPFREYSDDRIVWNRSCSDHGSGTCVLNPDSCMPIIYLVDAEAEAEGRADAMQELMDQVAASENNWVFDDRLKLAIDLENRRRRSLGRGPGDEPPSTPP